MWNSSLYVRDHTGQNLAGFYALGTDRILGWPTRSGFLLEQAQRGTPLFVEPGSLMDTGAFLGYLAGVAATDTGDELHCSASSQNDTVQLTRHMRASQLAQVTGIPLAVVQAVLADHLTFAQD